MKESVMISMQIIFYRKDFETLGLSVKNFETLGLMQRVRELYVGEATAVSYNFLHLTVQEYLAAFHLSQQPVEKQVKHLREYKKATDKQFHMVLRFLCGITQFQKHSSEQLNTFLIEDSGYDSSSDVSSDDSATDEESDDDSHVIRKVTFDTLHWLFEAHDSKVIAEVLGSSDIKLRARYSVLTSF